MTTDQNTQKRIEQLEQVSDIDRTWEKVENSAALGYTIDKNDGRINHYQSDGEGRILKEVELGEIRRRLSKRDLELVIESSYELYLTKQAGDN